ncbi:MAG: oxaloacetate decarboxylase, partial [Bacteroidales bacterium]|nr:oxaloacetate decarboxylase [Bacteroidales bacterium]
EELFEFAMHERQYRDYKSGVAKERFNADLEQKKEKAGAPVVIKRPVVQMPEFDIDALLKENPGAIAVQAPVKGQLLWQVDVDSQSCAPAVGTAVKAGQAVGYVQTWYGIEEIPAAKDGRIVAVTAQQGDKIEKNAIVALIL